MQVEALGRVLWDYLKIGAPLERREAIVAFGGHDLRVVDWAAQLWLDGWAPKLVLSGGSGYYTRKIWAEPEAHKFQRIAIERGVSAEAILVEDQSSNSGENVPEEVIALNIRPSLSETGAILWYCGYASQKGRDSPLGPAGVDMTNVDRRYLPSKCR
jgi:DUF218 domain